MKLNKEVIQTIIAVCVLFGMGFGAVNYFASASDLDLVANRLNIKILKDRLAAIQERIWMFDDRYGKNCRKCSVTEKTEYRKLIVEKEDILRQLKGK